MFSSPLSLDNWNVETLELTCFSLTTYLSKFVIVCGFIEDSGNTTDELFTSDTGRDWQKSLPPMLTKWALAISTGVFEHLVVAGGEIYMVICYARELKCN